MTEELSLDDGINQAIRVLEKVSERPLLVAVYGWPNSGKSYLIDRIADHFEGKGVEVYRGSGGPQASTFETLRDLPEAVRELLLFHCGWNRLTGRLERTRGYEDPNVLAERIAHRKIHLNIGIYNPRFDKEIEGDYDFIISNPDSKHKKAIS